MGYTTVAQELNIKRRRQELHEMQNRDQDAVLSSSKIEKIKSEVREGSTIKVKHKGYMEKEPSIKKVPVIGVNRRFVVVLINGYRVTYPWDEIIEVVKRK
ncbi:hypothetical protein [Cellulosilyticum sp. I15G10I2]|uniref:hypothetical protein n=1 Tax=Cellulosilyticum sp. I15G10I2 TaxID=1892843 RepID=UPI00085BFB21|nr:hypothetical protein [Cellulosilyticum sp. I15G10I2]